MTNRDGFNSDLQCCWEKWEFIDPTGLELYLPPYNCTDMRGCIRVAKALMPDVEMITVFEGGKMINCYRRFGKNWTCTESSRYAP